jgi:DNA-binding transcriptional ArsR family regulator
MFRRRISIKAKLYRGMADPSRLALLDALAGSPRHVSDLVAATGLSQPNVSQHLMCLRDCGLIISHRRGRNVFYRIASPRMQRLLRAADSVLDEVENRVRACRSYKLG